MKIKTIQISDFCKILKAAIDREDDIAELFSDAINVEGGVCCDESIYFAPHRQKQSHPMRWLLAYL